MTFTRERDIGTVAICIPLVGLVGVCVLLKVVLGGFAESNG